MDRLPPPLPPAAGGPWLLSAEHNPGHKRLTLTALRCYRLCALQRGSARLRGAGSTTTLSAPAVVVLPQGSPLTLEVPRAAQWYRLDFDPIPRPLQRVRGGHALAPGPDAPPLPPPMAIWGVALPVLAPRALAATGVRMAQTVCSTWWRSRWAHLRAMHRLGLWLLDLAEHGAEVGQPVADGRFADLERVALRQLVLGLGVRDLARHWGYGRQHFSARFRAEAGMTPRAWLDRLRRAEAFRLLHGEMPLPHVARCCGFRSTTAFGRWFRRATGTTPSAWRRAEAG